MTSVDAEGTVPEQPFSLESLDDPVAIDVLAKRVYAEATRTVTNGSAPEWVKNQMKGAPITASTEYICLYVNVLAKQILEKELGEDKLREQVTVDYLDYVESKNQQPLILNDKRYPKQSFLIVRTEDSVHLLDFSYRQLTQPPKQPFLRRMTAPFFRSPDPLPDCMAIKFSSEEELEEGLERHHIDPSARHIYTNLFHLDRGEKPTYGYQGSNPDLVLIAPNIVPLGQDPALLRFQELQRRASQTLKK